MLYVEFNVGSKEYKLRLNTRAIVLLEKKLECNPLAIFGNGNTIPSLTTMVNILHSSLQQYQHSITLEDTYNIFDEWLADGHTMTDFITIIIEIYKASGLMKDDSATTEKN